MKIIDLLNKIANREEVPKKFRIKGSQFKDLFYCYNKKYNCYDLIGDNFNSGCYVFGYSELNDEIEIIEEKKIPEKLDYCEENTFMEQKETTYLSPNERRLLDSNFKELGNKINSIIDYLNSIGE